MVYSNTTESIIYWNPDQNFFTHRAHHIWSDEYNSIISIEDKHTPGSLLLQQYPDILLRNLDLLNLIPCEIDLTYTPFCDTKIITYEIE